jgi:hypothetical protein
MGFSIRDLNIIYYLKNSNFLKSGDAVVELGSQQVNNDIIENYESLDKLAKLFGVAPFSEKFAWKIRDQKYLASGMQELPKDAPLARELYEHLGLKYSCVDIDASPQSIRLDLNFDSVPQERKGNYVLVTNLGTTEHVINQLNAFKVIHDLTARNGIMVHTLPFQGFATHGLVNYTMKFFWLLVRSNLYRVIDTDISAWKRVSMSKDIVNFVKKNSVVFENKEHVEKLELQDTGITVILQKCHDMDFVPPLDVSIGAKTDDSILKQRYWTVFERDSGSVFLLRVKNFLKKIFNY